jgi:hypothetical protein
LSHCLGIAPAVQITKYTNGQDADQLPGPTIYAGELVTWTYVVTNSGDSTLTSVNVSDDRLGHIVCPSTVLTPSGSMTCQRTGAAVAGQYANVGTVTGTPPAGPDVSASDPSHYVGRVAAPAIDVEKWTNGLDADAPPGPFLQVGTTVDWEYIVSNVGNVEVISITVTDDRGVVVSCPHSQLAERESMSCTGSGIAEVGQYTNTATVTARGREGEVLLDRDLSHYFGNEPGIALQKITNGEDADLAPGPWVQVGRSVVWTYLVTNSGNVRLTGIVVWDDQGVAVKCPLTTLAVDETMTCTASGRAQVGQYRNEGWVTAYSGDAEVSASDPSHYYGFYSVFLPLVWPEADITELPVECGERLRLLALPSEASSQRPPLNLQPR